MGEGRVILFSEEPTATFVKRHKHIFWCPILLSSLPLYGRGLTVYNSLFLSWPMLQSLQLLRRWLSLIADIVSYRLQWWLKSCVVGYLTPSSKSEGQFVWATFPFTQRYHVGQQSFRKVWFEVARSSDFFNVATITFGSAYKMPR